MNSLRTPCCRLAWSGIFVALAGCATQPPASVIALLHTPSRLSVLSLPPTVGNDSLRRLFHHGDKKVSVETLADDRQHVDQLVESALRQALVQSNSPMLSTATLTRIDAVTAMTIGQPVDPADLAVLQAQHPADAYLRVQLTDYGKTPKSWKSAYVTFEVVTTVAIGGLLFTRTATRPLALAYVAQEGVEEFSEGYAGFWLVNRLSRPVRVEVDFIDGKTGAELWHESETGMDDWRLAHLWHMDDATRGILLTNSTERAVTKLVKELESQ